MLDKKIIDIKYQSLRAPDHQMIKEKDELLADGWQPFFPPIIAEFTHTLSISTGTYQTWVKYE